ncbi:MAG: adenosylcobinamide-phosphate synthase CbiB [Cyanobacteria bacterium J06638_20]
MNFWKIQGFGGEGGVDFRERAGVVLAIAALLDYLIGDPWGWVHPVQVMGAVISRYSQIALKRLNHPLCQRLAGVGLTLLLVVGSGFVGWSLVAMSARLHPWFGLVIESVLLASCLAGRSLRAAAEAVLKPLQEGNLVEARQRLSLYVGRDTEALSEPEILRAVLETVTENATDGVMAPLFWAIAGSLTPLGAAPVALAYKAASTLDSMVGYRDAPYTHLGWSSARLEDALTWLPCRLHVLTLAILSRRPGHVLRICCRDAPQDPSPNAGWSECAYAAALGVQVGGTNTYRGIVKHKPLLGDGDRSITPGVIQEAMQLTRLAFLLWLGGVLIVLAWWF